MRSKRVGVSRKSVVVDSPSCKESWNFYVAKNISAHEQEHVCLELRNVHGQLPIEMYLEFSILPATNLAGKKT